ncbi:beta-ketoacyl synthase N-terminal-like domain-containing protein [Streptomyces sp. NPDC020490]|uniref:beta-ketoacyl synthase N-terminal-like domain-containing protein n=1 Tax=Streptomyces sp. NPDC020490 TaxID=3365078 RepID=UPI0037899C0F
MDRSDTRTAVVITGTGMVTPAGRGCQPLWTHWRDGSTALGEYRDPLVRTSRIRWFGHVPAEVAESAQETVPHRLRKFGTKTTFNAVLAAQDAIEQAGPGWTDIPEERRGLYVAQDDAVEPSADIFAAAFERRVRTDGLLFAQTVERLVRGRGLSPFGIIRALNNNALALISITHRFRGDCAALIQDTGGTIAALALAVRALRDGTCDTALVVGTGSYNHPAKLAAAYHARRLAPGTDGLAPLLSFDDRRTGTVLGEAAAAVVLERAADASRRGARARCEVLATTLRPTTGAAAAPRADAARVARSLAAAGRTVADLDAVLADGRGCVSADAREAAMLGELLAGTSVPVSTVRPVVGTLGAAAPLVDLVLGAEVMERQLLPPVPFLDAPLPAVRGFLSRAPVRAPLRTLLSLHGAFDGFGGAVLTRQPPHTANAPDVVPRPAAHHRKEQI